MQTILGAGGAIGTVLAAELQAYTTDIRLVSRNPKSVHDSNELVAADLTDAHAVQQAVKGSHLVYLTAGLQYKTRVWQQQWPLIVQNVVQACRDKGAGLVFFDNVYMYGKAHLDNLTEETPVAPSSKKGAVRAAIAGTILSGVKKGNLKAMIVRAADFYGPRVQSSALTETVYKNMKKGKRAVWLGDPEKVHNMTYVPDAAKATALLGNTEDAFGQVWHLPTDATRIRGKEWIELFASALGTAPKYSALSTGMVKGLGLFHAALRELGEMMYQFENDYFFNSAKFMKRFPQFALTPPQQGVAETIAADRSQ